MSEILVQKFWTAMDSFVHSQRNHRSFVAPEVTDQLTDELIAAFDAIKDKQSELYNMTAQNDWIETAVQAPTEKDLPIKVLFSDGEQHITYTNTDISGTHWKKYIPDAPPVAKVKTQEERDEHKARELMIRKGTYAVNDILDGIRYGRAEERRRFAAECLALFEPRTDRIQEAVHYCGNSALEIHAPSIRRLHELLTEAVK